MLLAVAAIMAVARSAHADEVDDFVYAQSAYSTGDYELAAQRFQAIFSGEGALRNLALASAARRYYAATLVFLDRRSDAVRQFEALLREEPDARLEQRFFTAETLRLFDEVRTRMASDLTRIRAARDAQRAEEARRRARDRTALLERLSIERVTVRAPRPAMFLPFGIGQFVNGDALSGALFLTSQALLGATMATSYFVGINAFPRVCVPMGICMAYPASRLAAYDAMQYVNVLSGIALVVTAGLGLVHANLTYRAQRTETRRVAPPTDLLRRLQLAVVPTSIGANAQGFGIGVVGAF